MKKIERSCIREVITHSDGSVTEYSYFETNGPR
jgi:hypothetical protein